MLAPEWPAPASLPGALSWPSLHGWLEGHPWEGRASVHGCWRVTRSGMRGNDWSGQPRRSQTSGGSDTWDSAPAGGLCPPSPSRGLAHANTSPLLYTSPLPWQVPQSEEGVWGGRGGLCPLRMSQHPSDSLSRTGLAWATVCGWRGAGRRASLTRPWPGSPPPPRETDGE